MRAEGLGAAPTLPRYLQLAEDEGAERVAQAAALATAHCELQSAASRARPVPQAPRTDALTRQVARAIAHGAGAGRPLDAALAPALHAPAAATALARVHDDTAAHRLADGLGANAVTIGRDMFFAAGHYAPGTPAGQRLLAHELTHVAQQGGEPVAIQREERQGVRVDVPLGHFLVTTIPRGGPVPGVDANLVFNPDPNGPYSAQIGIIQVANITDQSGRNGQVAGQPIDWSKVNDAQTGAHGTEAGRNASRTQAGDGVEAGWGVDVSHDAATRPRGSNVDPNYQQPDATGAASGAYGAIGWLRGPDDWFPPNLIDTPKRAADTDFRFEAYARGMDSAVTYGGIAWGFKVRDGRVVDDYANPLMAASAVFNAAMKRFRGFFSHEDVVLYFDTGSDRARSGEAAKLEGLVAFLAENPDARLQVTGHADHRGGEAMNRGLSQRRAEHVAGLLRSKGQDGRIDAVSGAGETDAFALLPSVIEDKDRPRRLEAAGALQANRRVVVRVVRTNAQAPATP